VAVLRDLRVGEDLAHTPPLLVMAELDPGITPNR
jgi:hypothetical protein